MSLRGYYLFYCYNNKNIKSSPMIPKIDVDSVKKNLRDIKVQYDRAIKIINETPLSVEGRNGILSLLQSEYKAACKQVMEALIEGTEPAPIAVDIEPATQGELVL